MSSEAVTFFFKKIKNRAGKAGILYLANSSSIGFGAAEKIKISEKSSQKNGKAKEGFR